jgi:Outer membrane efflux protein
MGMMGGMGRIMGLVWLLFVLVFILARRWTFCVSLSLVVTLWLALMGPASAETLPEALVRTYQGNPQLNAERARLRGTDESVPQALSGTYEGAKVALAAAEAEVRAASIALAGVQKEAAAGQRTTLEVLNSQQDLTAARARLIGAQRDLVIAAYALLSAVGRLDVKTLGLNTPDYAPEVHYHQVRDAWHGLRTPGGQ